MYNLKSSDIQNDNNTMRCIVRNAEFNLDGSLKSTNCTWSDVLEAMESVPQKELIVFGVFYDPDVDCVFYPILRALHAKGVEAIQLGSTFTHRVTGKFYHLCMYVSRDKPPVSEVIIIEDANNRLKEWSEIPSYFNYPSEKLTLDTFIKQSTLLYDKTDIDSETGLGISCEINNLDLSPFKSIKIVLIKAKKAVGEFNIPLDYPVSSADTELQYTATGIVAGSDRCTCSIIAADKTLKNCTFKVDHCCNSADEKVDDIKVVRIYGLYI